MSLVSKAQAKEAKCKRALQEDKDVVKAAKTALRLTSKELADFDPNLKKTVEHRNKCRSVYNECFLTLKSGSTDEQKVKAHLERLTPMLKAMECESSLMTGIVPALRKSTADRGKFETIAIDAIEVLFKNHLRSKQDEIDSADARKSSRQKEDEVARKALASAEEKMKASEEALKEAVAALEDAEKAMKEAASSAPPKEKPDPKPKEKPSAASTASAGVSEEKTPPVDKATLDKGELLLSKTEMDTLNKELATTSDGTSTTAIVEAKVKDSAKRAEIQDLIKTAEVDAYVSSQGEGRRPRRRGVPGHWALDTNVIARARVTIPIFDRASYKKTQPPSDRTPSLASAQRAAYQLDPAKLFDGPTRASASRPVPNKPKGVKRPPKEFKVPTMEELENLQKKIEALEDEHFSRLMSFLKVEFGVKSEGAEIEIRIQDYTEEQQRQLVDFVDRLARSKRRKK